MKLLISLIVTILISLVNCKQQLKIIVDNELNLDVNIDYQTFEQRVDHFDFTNTNTFQQRYIVNDQYWNGTGPIFLFINGESTLQLDTVTLSYQYVIWAKQVGALVVSLEHRYYGESFVMGDLSITSLKYLNIEQVLSDTATFTEWLITNYKIDTSKSSIVSFGGSYAGVLASNLRIKYPQLIDMAISSSAPVNQVLDFKMYLEVVQTTILSVENGTECLENIIISHEKVLQMLQEPDFGGAFVQETFNLCSPLKNENDASYFIQEIVGNFMSLVSMNNEWPNAPTVQGVCLIMINKTQDPLTGYIQLWNEFMSFSKPCIDVSYDTMISNVQNTTLNPSSPRMWQWLLCTQLGYFITTDASTDNQPFGHSFDLQYVIQTCSLVFDIPNMSPNINSTLVEYGGLYPSLSSVEKSLFISGTNDPWSALAISPFTNPNIVNTISIKDGAHCSDMTPPNSDSPPSLVIAQAQIFQFIINNIYK